MKSIKLKIACLAPIALLATGCPGTSKKADDSSEPAATTINATWRNIADCGNTSDGPSAREISFNTSAGTFTFKSQFYSDQATCEADGTVMGFFAQSGTYVMGEAVSVPTGNAVAFNMTALTVYASPGNESNYDGICTDLSTFPPSEEVSLFGRDCSAMLMDFSSVTELPVTNVVELVTSGAQPILHIWQANGTGPFVGGFNTMDTQGYAWNDTADIEALNTFSKK